MLFNEGKTPMVVFGVQLDKFYEEIKAYGKLPDFCHNLLFKTEKENYYKYKDSLNKKHNDNNINNEKGKKKYKKIKMLQIVKKTGKVKDKNNSFSIEKDYLFKKKLKNIEILNNKINDFSSLSSFSQNTTNNSNHMINYKKYKYKNFLARDILNKSELQKKLLNTSYINRLSSPRVYYPKISLTKSKSKKDEYIKKWNLPKVINFKKIIGREKELKNPHKFKYIDVSEQNYSPNYKYIDSYNSSGAVNYNTDIKKNFNKLKSSITRKIICNSQMMRDSSSSSLYLNDYINEEKNKNKKLRIEKMKEKYGKLFDFINFNKNRNKLKLFLINKNISDL